MCRTLTRQCVGLGDVAAVWVAAVASRYASLSLYNSLNNVLYNVLYSAPHSALYSALYRSLCCTAGCQTCAGQLKTLPRRVL